MLSRGDFSKFDTTRVNFSGIVSRRGENKAHAADPLLVSFAFFARSIPSEEDLEPFPFVA